MLVYLKMMIISIDDLTIDKLNKLIERGERFYVRGSTRNVLPKEDIEDRSNPLRYAEDSPYLLISNADPRQSNSEN